MSEKNSEPSAAQVGPSANASTATTSGANRIGEGGTWAGVLSGPAWLAPSCRLHRAIMDKARAVRARGVMAMRVVSRGVHTITLRHKLPHSCDALADAPETVPAQRACPPSTSLELCTRQFR